MLLEVLVRRKQQILHFEMYYLVQVYTYMEVRTQVTFSTKTKYEENLPL